MTRKSLILNQEQVHQKIRRMAYQILENNLEEKSLVVAGVDGQGYKLAELICEELAAISTTKTVLVKVFVNKENPGTTAVKLDEPTEVIRKKNVVLVDDVLNTGRVLAYGMVPFLNAPVSRIEVAVLVNRSHPNFPIQPTYTGYEISTMMGDHVEVILGEKQAVYLH